MNAPAAIQASYADYRRVKGRKVLQLIFEVPLEMAPQVHEVFGEPLPDGSTWVAVARIDLKAKPAPVAEEKQKKSWGELSIAQQAGILCCEKQFQLFVGDLMFKKRMRTKKEDVSEDEAALYVRGTCGVNSRAHIEGKPDAERKFKDIQTAYNNWLMVPA